MPNSGCTSLMRPLLVMAGFLVGTWYERVSFQSQPPPTRDESAQWPTSTDAQEEAGPPSQTALNLPPSTKSVVINVGSSLDPIMPNREMGPCARSIAVEPIVACSIPPHPQLHVLPAAVSSQPGVTSMRVLNSNGESSSLAEPAMEAYWNNNKRRDGTTRFVPVLTLSSIISAIPDTAEISMLMTDMQGFDFVAIREAADALKERATHIVTEVWLDDVHTYRAENDLCRDWLPFMTRLGYTLHSLRSYDVATIEERCEKQMRGRPERPAPDASAGLRESNAYWIRNDAAGTAFPKTEKAGIQWTDQDYATCGVAPSQ